MTQDDILEIARERMKEAVDADRQNTERAQSDLVFGTGEGQWPEAERRSREAEGKPTLTFNRMSQFVRKVTGQIRNLNPGIKVSASDSAANEDVAEIYEGIIREAEARCDASSIYEAAAESAAQCGIGHFRIRADYCEEDGFNQHILIERIYNPFAVVYDPRAKDPTRKDADYCFVIDEVSKTQFEKDYPKAKKDNFTDEHKQKFISYWTKDDNMVVAEYFWKDYDEQEIAITASGIVIKGPFPEGVELANRRKVRKPKVMWAKLSGAEVLEGPTRVAGKHIPVIAVTGEEIHVGEAVYRSGVIRYAKDAQIAYNVLRSSAIETVMLQPRAPYMVTTKQISGLEKIWESANQSTRPYLPYNADPDAPPPTRVPPPVPSAGLTAEAQIAADDMKATVGIYDASLGARSNETSGVAIRSRQQEAEISTSIYADNMVKAITHAGNIIVDMIPEVYDARRVIRILGADDQEKLVAINEVFISAEGPGVNNNMSAGKYAVRVSVGPTYASKKAEASAGMMDFLQRIPQAAPLIADLVAGAQEWPDSDRIADRLKKTVPPQVLEEDEKDAQDPKAMAARQQAQQEQAQQAQMMMAEKGAEIKKMMADADRATAEAAKAKAEAVEAKANAEKAIMETQELRRLLQQRGAVAPVPVLPGQPGQMPL